MTAPRKFLPLAAAWQRIALCSVKSDKLVKHARELASPFRLTSGKDFRLKDYRPDDLLTYE